MQGAPPISTTAALTHRKSCSSLSPKSRPCLSRPRLSLLSLAPVNSEASSSSSVLVRLSRAARPLLQCRAPPLTRHRLTLLSPSPFLSLLSLPSLSLLFLPHQIPAPQPHHLSPLFSACPASLSRLPVALFFGNVAVKAQLSSHFSLPLLVSPILSLLSLSSPCSPPIPPPPLSSPFYLSLPPPCSPPAPPPLLSSLLRLSGLPVPSPLPSLSPSPITAPRPHRLLSSPPVPPPCPCPFSLPLSLISLSASHRYPSTFVPSPPSPWSSSSAPS